MQSDALAQLAALAEPNRRLVYEHLAREKLPLGRRQLAASLGISESLLTFHLDKLAEAGLVRVVAAQRELGRLGRPARSYELVTDEVAASIPPRRYDQVAEVLALAAREQRPNESLQAAAERVASSYGTRLGTEHAEDASNLFPPSMESLLTRLGYEPCQQGPDLLLQNCPFDRLREVNTPLVCGVNFALLKGYLKGAGVSEQMTARLVPDEARCCVVVSGPAEGAREPDVPA